MRSARKLRASAHGLSNPGLPRSAAFVALVLLLAHDGNASDATPPGTPPPIAANAGYVGSPQCRPCHEAEYSSWKGSDHDLAMQEATEATVLGDFGGTAIDAHGVTSTFSRRDGRFYVRTDGPDGRLTDYAVKYTFGVRPLQQYLVEFPGGRLQALPLAWDSRSRQDGGQHWFHLYPNEKIDHTDQLHWTGLYQNWNLQCASCHSTNLRKHYDPVSSTYVTTWAEIDVACESCHGAGADHVAWAAGARSPYVASDAKGLRVLLRRPKDGWRFESAEARYATQDPAAAADRTAANKRMNVCAACHARRSAITEDSVPGAPLEDSQRLHLLTEPLYFADGQQHDEVYTWGSFLQSKMFVRGVTCTDCHDAHTLKTRADGNALCAQCHNPAVFDTKAHHFHESGSKGSQCVACHMPSRNYMVIDARRDHSLRVPRPDLAEALGTPDACSGCHAGRTPKWAADTLDTWYGARWRSRPESGSTLHKSVTDGARALPSLLALAGDTSRAAIVRATAAELAGAVVRPDALPQARALLADPDPMIRSSAIDLLEQFDPDIRTSAIAPLLADPIRAVRTEAARVLADVPDGKLSPEQRAAREAARKEYLASLQMDADWPAAMANLGNFQLREGHMDEAIAAYQRALTLDPKFAGAYVNLADAWRAQGNDVDGERTLRLGLAALPDAAALHHALGLLLVRKGDKALGTGELGKAATLEPGNARYAYVNAVALQSAGKTAEALAALVDADRRQPYDLDILGALVSMNLGAGHPEAALPYARMIAEVLPDDPGIRQLLGQLENGTPPQPHL